MPDSKHAEPIYRKDDQELLGYVSQLGSAWSALTTFGYEFAVVATREEAERLVRRDGLRLLRGTWQYYDRDDHEWHSCVIKKVQFNRVTVMRTTSLGYNDPDHPGFIVINHPDSASMASPL